ncbi:hypothetical protein KL941_003688 [Ogataea angusta]|nr:hypothetical protein KL941_003688 [Ogataea angusta]
MVSEKAGESSKNLVVTTVLSPEELQDVDQGFGYALETDGVVLDPEFEKKVVRKTDWYILPMMCILMSCQLMDKSTNSYASITGLRTDLNMSSRTYSWVGSSFYLGYLGFCYPASMLLQRFPLSKTLGCAVIAWGVVLRNPARRLGVCESFMDPAYMTSQWYKMSSIDAVARVPVRCHGCDYDMFWHFILIHIPDIPVKAWFLNDEEKKYVVERIRGNRTGFGNQHFKLAQLKEAASDITTYLFFFYMFGYGIPNGSIGNFSSILLSIRPIPSVCRPGGRGAGGWVFLVGAKTRSVLRVFSAAGFHGGRAAGGFGGGS